ncbi:unnamed protein product, partial [Porites evermanni]
SFYSSILEKLLADSMDVSVEVSANSANTPRRNLFCPVRTPKKLKKASMKLGCSPRSKVMCYEKRMFPYSSSAKTNREKRLKEIGT